jgi:DNA modification methylase
MIEPNALFQADCIDLLQRLDTESVDLTYMDPPLSSHVARQRQGLSHSDDGNTWHHHLQFISKVCQELHRVLKPTGALFFHAEPFATFSIRLILNQVFGEANFRNEFVWSYRRFPSSNGVLSQHDSILFYGKSKEATDNPVRRPLTSVEAQSRFTRADERGAFALVDLTAAVPRRDLQFEWKGGFPGDGRSWRFKIDELEALEREGRIYWSQESRRPQLKVFLNEHEGVDSGTIWTDIPRLSLSSAESIGYPTQKPLGVIERILCKGSNPGEVILDPFSGSGTTMIAAQRHERAWIVCDLCESAIRLSRHRFEQEFGQHASAKFSFRSAESLARLATKGRGFKRMAVTVDDFGPLPQLEFVLNQAVVIEETRHFEFKEIRTDTGAIDSIVNTADEYAVAFLNSEGGRIYWGIRDKDRIVVGVRLRYHERDKLRRDVSSKLNSIEPRVDPSKYRIEIYEVSDSQGKPIADLHVVELVVPASNSNEPYFTGSGEAWVKVDGSKQKLRGIALTDFIRRRIGNDT